MAVKCLVCLTDSVTITTLGTSEEKIKDTEDPVMSTRLNSDVSYIANSVEVYRNIFKVQEEYTEYLPCARYRDSYVRAAI